MLWNIPRIIISGLSGGCGKTFASVGIAASFRERGRDVFPFKKGPDYIDSAWLSRAAGRACYNLDIFLMGVDGVIRSFESHTGIEEVCRFCGDDSCAACERLKEFVRNRIVVIEGNRGLFDGMDDSGTYSTAELSKLLRSPVILVLDSTKTTRTLAAEVLGCQKFDPDVPIAGVILNRVAGKRHEQIIRSSIEGSCGIPVIGVIPKLRSDVFPERHLGLITPQEYADDNDAVAYAARAAEDSLSIEKLALIAGSAPSLAGNHSRYIQKQAAPVKPDKREVTIGVIRDRAFSFYYPDNLEALMHRGARIREIDATKDPSLPDIDGLYIGGGFPETNAVLLSDNKGFRSSVRDAVEQGLPVYAECGGALYMGRSLTYRGMTYPMSGVLPVEFGFEEHPQGHGYTILEVKRENPYFDLFSTVRGHEFHYSRAVNIHPGRVKFIFKVHKGYGFNKTEDGICYKNLLAVYSHVHAAGTPQWAENLIRAADIHAMKKKNHAWWKENKTRQRNCA